MSGGVITCDLPGKFGQSNTCSPKRKQFKRPLSNTSLVVPLRARILSDWLRGVTERSLSQMYLITREGIEEIVRKEVLLALGLRAARATACALVALFVGHAVQPWGAEQEIAWRAPRSNRGRRGRRRGLDDGYRPAEIRQAARIAA
jgi:hypothetical protein